MNPPPKSLVVAMPDGHEGSPSIGYPPTVNPLCAPGHVLVTPLKCAYPAALHIPRFAVY